VRSRLDGGGGIGAEHGTVKTPDAAGCHGVGAVDDRVVTAGAVVTTDDTLHRR